ncbi:hypothetical protein [Alteribacter aurantiacus]|uniref:hypothetical protein n=1 Tax=Alteribacter aurantiacus TaxID=254410 RepID=UPI0004247C8B|nr:hypothetical protein [Alteribacter aurantiacus]
MGHDISGFNKAGKEVAYARFSYGNHNSTILYRVLDADRYYAGVSGTGERSTFTKQELENALSAFNVLCKKGEIPLPNDFLVWDKKQTSDFLQNCLSTAKKEGKVEVYFG